jgi:transcriptional regulator with XRE-family HTH domain
VLAWREQHGLSQQRLAELLGTTNVTVYRWESGRQAIPPMLELALRWLDHELGQDRVETTLSAADELILSLGREAGQDVDSDVQGTLRAYRANNDNAADLDAAVAGSRVAMIRVRKAAGLRAFR